MRDSSQIEREFREYERKIQRLKQLERELNSLDIRGFESEVRSIRSKIKDPNRVNQVEREISEIKQKIEAKERKRKEAVKVIDTAKSVLQKAKSLNLVVREAERLLNEAKSLLGKDDYANAIERANKSKGIAETGIDKKLKQSREEALKAISKAHSLLQQAKKLELGINTKSEEEKLNNAKLKLDEEDFSNATKLANKCKSSLDEKINEYKEAAKRNAKQSLDFAYSKIKEAEKLGINMSSAQDLHRKAILEFDNREYEEAVRLAEGLKELVKNTETKCREAKDSMKSAESAIEEAKKFGCDVSEAEKLLNKAESAFNGGNYTEATGYAKQAEETAKRIREESKPEIEVELPEKTFKPNYWKTINLIVRNKGDTHARGVNVSFSKEAEVKGLKELNIDSGEEEKLSIALKPVELGEVPLTVKTVYKDVDGKEYGAENFFMLNVGEEVGKEEKEEKKEKAKVPALLTIERAIYDPCKRDFIEGRLPRMKEWINRYDPGAYWFAASIQNNTDRAIEEWGVDLEFSSALKIEEAKIEGIEIEIPHEAHLGLFKILVPKEYGIVIPKGGAQRVYFKLRADKPKTTYEISGVFKIVITGDVPIRAKEFKYLCDAGVSPEAVKAELKKIFSEKDAARLANAFRIVQEISSNYCNTNTTARDINKEFDLLKVYFTENEFLDEVGGIQRRINAELREDERLDERHVEEVKNFCEKFTEMWIAKFLR